MTRATLVAPAYSPSSNALAAAARYARAGKAVAAARWRLGAIPRRRCGVGQPEGSLSVGLE
jgi:hypothetical protein